MKDLNMKDYEIKLVRDLGMVFQTEKSKQKCRMAIFKCKECAKHIRRQVGIVKNGTGHMCKECGITSMATKNSTHGMKKTKIYSVWMSQKKRCNLVTDKRYDRYGGRGIKFSDKFLDFKTWFEYISSLDNYNVETYTLDRIDNDGNYDVGNLRWATKEVQSRNDAMLMKTNTSGYRGVSFNKSANKWKVKIVVSYKTIHLGYYDNPLDGAVAYNKYVIDNKLEHTINKDI